MYGVPTPTEREPRMNCQHITAPASPAHRAHGLHAFCVKCGDFFDAEGQTATVDQQVIRNTLADRLASLRSDHPLIGVLRHGGSLN